MITLGGIILPDGTSADACSPSLGRIDWINRFDWQPMVSRIVRTIGGRVLYAQAHIEQGRPIILEARQGVCWLSQAQRDAILALASLPDLVAFTYDDVSLSCMFDHESGAAEFSRLWVNRDTYWYGIIRLISVSTT